MQARMEWVFKARFLRAGSSDEKSFLKLGTDCYKRQQKEFRRKHENVDAATSGNAAVVQAQICR